jgi:hypothetical protein
MRAASSGNIAPHARVPCPFPGTGRLGIRDTSITLEKKMSIEHEGDDAKRWIGD